MNSSSGRAPDVLIRMLNGADLDEFLAHSAVVQSQSGQDGDPIFSTMSPGPDQTTKMGRRRSRGWSTDIAVPKWIRTWGAWVDGEMVGDVELHGGSMPAELHRAQLGIGIQRDFRSRGIGTLLMETALAWAGEQVPIEWIDLGVFAGNPRAELLYRRLGFHVVGTRQDAFRIAETSVDDILMTLSVADDNHDGQHDQT